MKVLYDCYQTQVHVPDALRPNKPKRWSLEWRKVYCRTQQGEQGGSRSERTELPDDFRGRDFIGKFWGEGCRVCDLPLIGWWGGNRVVFQESQSAFWFQLAWGPCARAQPEVTFLHLSGAPSSCRRTQRSVSDCYAHLRKRNQDLPNCCTNFSFCIPSLP